MRFTTRARLACSAAVCAQAFIFPALADASNAEGTSSLAEVVVTAQKYKQRLIDTPESVSVVSSEDLAKMGATQFSDFANTVPGLSFTTGGAGLNQVTLRGITTGFNISQTVGIYVDDVPIGKTGAFAQQGQMSFDTGLFDLDRIEVLRGPQGTLYGASTMGGVIKYVTKEPNTHVSSVDTETGVSTIDHGGISYDENVAVNAPLVEDKAALRMSGYYSHDGGYIDNVALGLNDVNRSHIYGGRLDLLFTPTEKLSIRVSGFMQNIARDGEADADYLPNGTPEYGSLDQYRFLREPFVQEFRLFSGTVKYDFGPASLTSITSYQTMQTSTAYDYSRIYVPLLNPIFGTDYSAIGDAQQAGYNSFVQEVRLASDAGHRLQWLIGGYFTNQTANNHQESVALGPQYQPAPNNDFFDFRTPSTYREYAAFGDLTYHLTDRFELSGGARLSKNEQSATQIGGGLLIGSTPTRSSSDRVATYLADARYKFGQHVVGYVRYATGFRPGGPNFVVNNPATGKPLAPPTFAPDRLASYEGGIKAETADRRFSIDVDGYYIDWMNIQIPVSANGIVVYGNDPGGATVRGSELTLKAKPVQQLMLTGAFAYQDAQLSQANAFIGGAKGEQLPDVPHFTAALNADYMIPVGDLLPTVGATFRYVGHRTGSFNMSTTPQYQLPAYSALDLRVGVILRSIDLQLYVHNVTNELGQLAAYPFAYRGDPQPAIMQPRTVGISVTKHFR